MKARKRRVLRIGNSFGVTLTKEELTHLKANKGDAIKFMKVSNGFFIKKENAVAL